MRRTPDSMVLPPPDGFEAPDLPRRSRKPLLLGIAVGILVLVVATIVGIVVFMLRFEEQQVTLVEDALAILSAGDPLPVDMVCADPDDLVRGLVEDPRSWPVGSYDVLGISALSYSSDSSLSQWYVDAIVNDRRWLVEVWDADAGRMSGLCGLAELPG